MKKKLTILGSYFCFTLIVVSLFAQLAFATEPGEPVPPQSSDRTACVVTRVGNPAVMPSLPPECYAAGTAAGDGNAVVALARKYVYAGTYVWAAPSRNWSALDPSKGKAPKHFDCSGYSGWVWYWATGGKVNMNGQTDADWLDAKGNGSTRYQKFFANQRGNIQPGDLVYFGSIGHVTHMGIYEGPGACGKTDCFLEYYSSGKPGRSSSLGPRRNFVGFMRPIM